MRLTYGWPTDQLIDDPRLAYNSMSKTFCRQIFESLLDIDPVSGELLPWLASSWHYRDPLTLELTVDRARSFSDGAPVTPEAVAECFTEILTLKDVSPLPAAVSMLTGLDRIDTDRDTIRFRFARHNAAFLRSLTSVNLAVSSRSGLGSGRWRRVDDGLTDGTRLLAFRKSDAGDLCPGAVHGLSVAELNNPGISYGLCPNASRGRLTDPRIRRALSLLVDRRRLQPVLDRAGYTVASSVLTPSTLDYRDCTTDLAHDPETAHRLLGGRRLSFEVVFNSTFSPVDAAVLTAVAAQWAEHGVELTLADVGFPELRTRQESGDYDFRFFYFTGSDPDALRYQFSVSQRNMNRRSEPDDLDALLESQLHCADPAARRDVVHDIQRQIVDRGLWLPLCNVRTTTSYRPDVLPEVYLDAEALARIP